MPASRWRPLNNRTQELWALSTRRHIGGTGGAEDDKAARSRLHQATADCQSAHGERQAQIAQQAKLVRELAAEGHDATKAQHLLRFLQPNLDIMNAQRQQIMSKSARARAR